MSAGQLGRVFTTVIGLGMLAALVTAAIASDWLTVIIIVMTAVVALVTMIVLMLVDIIKEEK